MTFKFIDDLDTSFTAADAGTLTEMPMSGVFIGQTKTDEFRLGNLDSLDRIYKITASGLNATILDDVNFSIDGGENYYTTVSVSGIRPNGITDPIMVRYSPPEGETLGVGSFLIRVDEY